MPNETESRRSNWESLPAIIALLGATAAIAYFLGKQYWDSYYSAFGIPPSAVRLSPPEYMFASKRFFTFLVFVLGSYALIWFTPRRTEAETTEPGARTMQVRKVFRALGELITSPLPEWGLPERWGWTETPARQIHYLGAPFLFYAFCAAGVLPFWAWFALTLPYVAFLLAVGLGNRLVFVALAAVFLFFGVVAFVTTAPGSLAEKDAAKIMDDPGRLPQVEVLWDKTVEGLTPISVDVSGASRARILTTNSDTYFFLVEDQDSNVVVAVPSTAIRAVRYVPKSD
jgi:hypothetical protein